MNNNVRLNNCKWLAFNLKVEKKLRDPSVWKITKVALHALLLLSKSLNLIIGDHRWHSQTVGLEKISLYRYNFKNNPELREQENSILTIFDALENPPCTKEQFLDLVVNADTPRIKKMSGDSGLHFQVLASEFGKNSQLEGGHLSNSIQLLTKFCGQHHPDILEKLYGVDAALLHEIQQTIDPKKYSPKELLKALETALAEGRNVLISGGWIGLPAGHAMMYEVIPTGTETINFRIYNLGAGSSEHAGYSERGKTKSAPCVEWKGIQKSALLQPTVLEILIEMKTKVYYPGITPKAETDYDAPDIYSGFRQLLNPTSMGLVYCSPLYMTRQHSGTCSWRSFEAFLSTRIPEVEYKRLLLDLKLSSVLYLVDGTYKWFDPAYKEDLWGLVHKAKLKLARKVDHAFSRGLITSDYLIESNRQLKRVEEWLKSHAPTAPSSRDLGVAALRQKITNFCADAITWVKSKIVLTPQTSLQDVYAGRVAAQAPSNNYLIVQRIKELEVTENPQEALGKLTEAADLATQFWTDGHGDAPLNVALHDYILKLPLNIEFWRSATASHPDGIATVSRELKRLGAVSFKTSYMKACQTGVHPQMVFIQEKMKKLFLMLGEIENPAYAKLNTAPIFRHTEGRASAYQLYREVYIQQDNIRKTANSNLYAFCQLSDGIGAKLETIQSDFLFEFLSQNDKQLLDRLDSGLSRDQDGDPSKLKSLHFLLSDQLPVWMAALRDTCVYAKWLYDEKLVKFDAPDRTQNLECEWSLRKGDTTQIDITLHGVRGFPTADSRYGGDYEVFDMWQTNIKGTDIKKVIEDGNFGRYSSEKQAMGPHRDVYKRKKIKSFTDEERLELKQLFIMSAIRPWRLLGYFLKYPSKLNETEYRVLFKRLLFQKATYTALADSRSKFSDALQEFLHNQLEMAFREGEIAKSVFLNQVTGILETFKPQSSLYSRTYERFAGLLHKPGLSVEDKKRIYLGLIEYVYNCENPTDEQIFYALRGLLELSSDNNLLSRMDPEMVKCRDDFAFKYHSRISACLGLSGELNQNFIYEILKDRLPERLQWQVRESAAGVELVAQNGGYIYNPSMGVLKGVRESQTLPAAIADHPQFKSVFPNPLQHVKSKHNVYKVTTCEGGSYFIRLGTANALVIQKLCDDDRGNEHYCRLDLIFGETPSLRDVYRRGTRVHGQHFQHGFQGWVEASNPNIIRFKESGKPDSPFSPYQLDIRSGVVHDVDNQLVLAKSSGLLNRFEHPDFIHEWQTERPSRLSVLELPRYQLAFNCSQSNPPVYESREFPGYYLCLNERVPALGIYQEYLLLQNEAGKQKLLIPQLESTKVNYSESLAPLYAMDFIGNEQDQKQRNYYIYDIDETGFPTAKTLEPRLWLAKTLTLVQKHRHAAAILRACGEKITPYSEQEKKILRDITKVGKFNGDASGDGISIRLYACYLLVRNSLLTGLPDEQDIDSLGTAYHKYLAHLKNVTALPLKKHEEIYLCRLLLKPSENINRKSDSTLEVRLKELESGTLISVATEPQISSGSTALMASPVRSTIFTTRQEMVASAKKHYLITRAGGHIVNHFPYFHALAAGAPCPEKSRLETACKFMLTQSSRPALAKYLLYIMDHPEAYRPPSDWMQDNWAVAVISAAAIAEEPRAEIAADYPKERFVAYLPKQKSGASLPFVFVATKEPTVINDAKAYFQKVLSENDAIGSLGAWLSGAAGLNALEKREYDRLTEDCREVSAKENFTITDASLDALHHRLLENRDENRERISALKRSIVKKSRRRHTDPHLAAREGIRAKGGVKKVEFDDVLISFARKNPASLAAKNSALDAQVLHEIYTETAEYLQLVTWEQQRGRALREIRKIGKADGERKSALVQSLRATICAERAYDVQENPAFLVFEFYSQKLLWEKQIKALQLFLERKEENPVMEMIMGSGKSEVLLPLLALLRADGECISMIIAPQTLFENVSSNTHKINKEAFGQSLHTIHFDRNTELTESRLVLILKELQHVRDNKEALVVTSKTIQCIILKFMEQSYKHYSGDMEGIEPPRTLKLLGEIVHLLSTHGLPIVDEADSILRIMHETSFNLGGRVAPNRHEIEFVGAIYNEVLALQNDTPVLTEEIYAERWKMSLQQSIMKMFQGATKGMFGLTASEANTLQNLPQDLLWSYLCRDAQRKEELDKWFIAIPEKKVQDLVALAAEELSHLLSFTLLKEWNVAYGRDRKQKSPIPVPFEFASTPKSGSVFANPYVTMNYAFQTYLKEGVDDEIVRNQIKRLQDEAMNEMRLHAMGDYSETKAWREFCILKGDVDVPFLKIDQHQLKLLVTQINSSQKHLLTFITYFILPQLVLYSHKLTCSPINMISLFRWFSGFTGTLWNGKSLYHTASLNPEIGTDAKTLSILWRNCSSEDAVVMVQNLNSESLLSELNQIHHEVLIDGGGYLKELSNGAVAQKMLQLSGTPTVFYNPKGEKTVLEQTGETPLSESRLKLNQRRTYLDHSHTVGANVLQSFNALGLVTIGKGILLRDLLQFVWRMRGLADLQNVKFVVSEEVAILIRQALGLPDDVKIRFVHILAYAIKNQAEQQGRDNHKGFLGQLWNVPQQLLLRVLFNKDLSEQQKKMAYDSLENVWVKLVATCASDSFGAVPIEIDAADDVDNMINKATTFINECFDECPFLEIIRSRHDCLRDFEAIRNQIKVQEPTPVASSSTASSVDCYFLPPKASSPEHPQDETVDLELDLDVNTQKELETVQEDAGGSLVTLPESNGVAMKRVSSLDEIELQRKSRNDLYHAGAFDYTMPLSLILHGKAALSKFAHLFEGIDFSVNMLQWRDGATKLDSYEVFGIQRTPPSYINFNGYTVSQLGLQRYTLVHTESEINPHTTSLKPSSYDITCGFRCKSEFPLNAQNLEHVVKIKFFFGEVAYSKDEQQILERWIAEAGHELLKELFEKYALLGFPSKAERYRGSWLQKKLQPSNAVT